MNLLHRLFFVFILSFAFFGISQVSFANEFETKQPKTSRAIYQKRMPLSAFGISKSTHMVTIGPTLLFIDVRGSSLSSTIIPLLFHIRYTGGAADWCNVSIELDSIIAVTFLDVAVRFHFFRSPYFSVALRPELKLYGYPIPAKFSEISLSASAVLMLSTGTRYFQINLEGGPQLSFAGDMLREASYPVGQTGTQYFTYLGASLEFQIKSRLSLYLQARLITNGDVYATRASVGVSL